MPIIQWSDAFRTGDAEVDGQHQTLFRLFNDLHVAEREESSPETVGRILEAFAAYIDEHFGTEERLMAAVSYPDMARHLAQHRQVEGRTRVMLTDFKAGRPVPLREISAFLGQWLTVHINQFDRAMVAFVQAHRE